jgi:ACS family hexuronate transporter-like MFS transporter
MALGPPLLLIYLVAGVGSIAGGAISSALIKRGLGVLAARKYAMLVSLLCILPVALAPRMLDPWSASLLIGLAFAAHQGWVANLWSIIADMVPHCVVSSVFGLGGLVGACVGMAMARVVGYLLDTTGSYALLFFAIPCVYAVSLLVLHLLLPKEPERL